MTKKEIRDIKRIAFSQTAKNIWNNPGFRMTRHWCTILFLWFTVVFWGVILGRRGVGTTLYKNHRYWR